jgi:hypothetical protein
MYKIVGGILLAVGGLLFLPYLLYWFLWFFTGRGLPPKPRERGGTRNVWRPEEIWALKTVGMTAVGVGLYRATVFLWVR